MMRDGLCLFLDDVMSVFGMFKSGHKVSQTRHQSRDNCGPYVISTIYYIHRALLLMTSVHYQIDKLRFYTEG